MPAGCVVGNGSSLAWRVYDAQFWGVPQRRKRIYLVADFGSERAGEILFESESMSGDSEQSGEAGQATPCNAEGSARRSDPVICLQGGGRTSLNEQGSGWTDDGKSYTLNTVDQHGVCVLNDQGGSVMDVDDKAGCLRAQEHGHQPVICYGIENHAADSRCRLQEAEEPCQTLTSRMGTGGGNVPMVLEAVSIGNGQLHNMSMSPVANCLDTMHDQQAILTNAKPPRKYIVRRLTPTECGRLQGFPDGWTDGANGSDSAIYKMWGNGIALPCAADVMGRLANELRNEVTIQ